MGDIVFVNEPETEFDAVLTEDITHRPAVDISESRQRQVVSQTHHFIALATISDIFFTGR